LPRVTDGPGAGASRSGWREEFAQLSGQLDRCLFGDVIAAVDGLAADVDGPVAPDGERVAVEIFEVVPGRPQEQQRRLDPPARGAIGLVVLPVDAESGAVVLHRGNHSDRGYRG
jgi:hypothetical protein